MSKILGGHFIDRVLEDVEKREFSCRVTMSLRRREILAIQKTKIYDVSYEVLNRVVTFPPGNSML